MYVSQLFFLNSVVIGRLCFPVKKTKIGVSGGIMWFERNDFRPVVKYVVISPVEDYKTYNIGSLELPHIYVEQSERLVDVQNRLKSVKYIRRDMDLSSEILIWIFKTAKKCCVKIVSSYFCSVSYQKNTVTQRYTFHQLLIVAPFFICMLN